MVVRVVQKQSFPAGSAEFVLQEAKTLAEASKWDESTALLTQEMERVKSFPDTHYILGRAAYLKGQPYVAFNHFNDALAIDPQHVDTLYIYGLAKKESLDLHGAIHLFNQVIKLRPKFYEARGQMAMCLRDSNRAEIALRMYQTLEAENPSYPYLDNQIAIVYDVLGDEEKAADYFEKALVRSPGDTAVLYNMFYRRKYALDHHAARDALKRYDVLCKQEPNSENLMNLCYALGNLFEKHKQHDRAFEYFKQANAIQAMLHPTLIEQETRWYADIKSAFNPEIFAANPNVGVQDGSAIFILGMPRSGTSLVEQILNCHADVSGAGELELLRRIVAMETPKYSHAIFPAGLEKLSAPHWDLFGRMYVQMLKTYGTTPHIIDKMPHNFYMIGFIKLIMPNAKIIHCVRDPMDTCWSIWRQAFVGRHTYKYEFDTMARHYGMYIDLMKYWHSLFPGWIYDVCYEDLVENPEPVVRGLLNHCGLEWEPACLNFHEAKHNVFTASTFQVRQPLYKSALKSWEPVRKQISPLIEQLKKHDAIVDRYRGDYQID